IGACVLGFADPDVDGAVRAAIDRGVACTLNCPEEPALADVYRLAVARGVADAV
ncbi:MAG: hypothetical protein IT162_13175, partial [Bryobacterales bacterium]|nr:hypothetical protein [Bryobacterales bacterium]